MASTSAEAPPSSPPETPATTKTTKTKYCNFSIPFVDKFKAKFCKPNTVENKSEHHRHRDAVNHRDAADAESSSGAANKKDDLEKMISKELEDIAPALENHRNHMNSQIELANEKFQKLQENSGSSERELEELHRAIRKLKLQIPVQVNILPTTNEDDHPDGAALSGSFKREHKDLLFVDSAFWKAKEYMEHMRGKINEAWEKFKVLQSSPDPEGDFKFKELRKAIDFIKVGIPSLGEIPSSDSDGHRNRWPNINREQDVKIQFFHKEPEVPHTSDSNGLLNLESVLRRCLLCFFNFPPEATIKRTTMIYLWIALGYTSFFHERGSDEDNTDEDYGNRIFDELVEKGFIQPIYQNCSLVPHSCKMSGSVYSSLHEVAKYFGLTSVGTFSPDHGLVSGHSFLINVRAPIITSEHDKFFSTLNDLKGLYFGRWQSSAMHHIELADGFLRGLEKMKTLKFLSLRGISMITELPTSMLKLNSLEMLDLRACHNLEVIPNDIHSLQSLTYLDMSECYLLEHMPKSLAQLPNLEVIKGFLIGDLKLCTLSDLSKLPKLRKLNIYVSVKKFDRRQDFDDLKNFKVLQKLTISWGGCSLQGKEEERRSSARLTRGPLTLPPRLQKLDLQCFPATCLTDWLRPAEIKQEQLKKLYIQGGQLSDMGQNQEGQAEQWNVEILRLKYLSNLKIDGSKLEELFPKLIYLYKEECPQLTEFPCNKGDVWKIMEDDHHWDGKKRMHIKRGLWMNTEAHDWNKHLEKLRKYLEMSGGMISSSSDPTSAQDDSNICSVDEEHIFVN